MKTYSEIKEELNESRGDPTKEKPDQDAFKSFELVNGDEFFLAQVSRKAFGGVISEFAYISKDKKKVADSIFSGGQTGGGVNLRRIQPLDRDTTFTKFIK